MSDLLESFSRKVAAMPRAERAQAVREAVSILSPEQREAFAEALGARVSDPDQETSNTIWRIIIWSSALVMIGAVVVLSIGVWVTPVKDGTKPETILTVFTTVTAFLAGLLAPSPVKTKSGT
jgi:anti-sigma-K factor RskA